MNNMKLRMDRASILERVRMVTAYHGVKDAEASTRYERVAAVEADMPLLDAFWLDGCAHVDHQLREWLKEEREGCVEQGREHVVELRVPDSCDHKLSASLCRGLEHFMVSYVVARWMAVVWPEQENRYSADATQVLAAVRESLCGWWRRSHRHVRKRMEKV